MDTPLGLLLASSGSLAFLGRRRDLPFELKLNFFFLRSAFVFDIDDRLLGHGNALPRNLETKWLVALQSIGQPSQLGDEIFFRISLFDVTLACRL